MATLNLQTTSSILGKTTTVSLSSTSVTSLLSNASSSGFVYKVRSIIVANAGAAAANITVAYYSAAALGGTAYPIVSTVSIPASGVLPILDSNTFIYMPDDSSIGVTAGTANYLTVTCAYEQVTADALPTPPGPQAGGLWVWGSNSQGQLGQNNLIYRSSPVQVGALTDWTTVLGSTFAKVGLKSDGTIWAWGNNYYGTLGQNNTINASSPVQIGALTNWSAIGYGSRSAAAIKTDGTLWVWGNNYAGQLGQNNLIRRSSPVQVGAGTSWSKISMHSTVFSIKTDGTLWSWGNNSFGQLGQSDTVNRSSPVQVGALTNWSLVYGRIHGAAIKTDGTLWTWGNNNSGQLGLNIRYTYQRSSPTQVGALTNWSKVGAYNNWCQAIKTNGTLWTWGYNNNGQLGQNDRVNRSSPVQVGALTTWSVVSKTTSYNVLAAIKTDGTLWVCGNNSFGRLGQDDTVNRSSPVQVGALTTWQSVSSGNSLSAIKT